MSYNEHVLVYVRQYRYFTHRYVFKMTIRSLPSVIKITSFPISRNNDRYCGFLTGFMKPMLKSGSKKKRKKEWI